MSEIIRHTIDYTIDELKELIVSKSDAEIMHKIKRHIHKITINEKLPGEIFRKYPKKTSLAYIDFRPFLESDEFKKYSIEVSNYGRIRINNIIEKQIEEGEGCFYIKIKNRYYPVWRFVAEVWCEFPSDDTYKRWEVHHISNDGNDNTPENLIWIKDTDHKLIPPKALNKIEKVNFEIENNEEIDKILTTLHFI